MNKSSKSCKECDAHHYWLHMNDQEKHFFKVMMGDFQHRMIIPQKFADNFRGKISEVIKLEVPNGAKFNVHVSRELNKLVLLSGWSAFGKAQDLQHGDFLVFRYIGNSCFKVLIFDLSGCEKVSSCVGMSNAPVVRERSEDAVDMLSIHHDGSTQSPRNRRSLKRRCGGSSHSRKAARMTSTDSPSWRSAEDATSSEDMPGLVISGGIRTSTKSRYVVATRCILTVVQRAAVDALEQKIQPKIPLYVTAMNTTAMMHGCMIICKAYAVEHLPQEDQTITLSQPGSSKTWHIKLHIGVDGKRILSAGWPGFVSSNKMQVGDVCVFEVLKSKRRVSMKLHILKGSRHPPAEDAPSEDMLEPVNSGGVRTWTKSDYVVPRQCNLTVAQRAEVDALEQKIQPKIPLYVATMNNTSVMHGYVAICKAYAVQHLPQEDQTISLYQPSSGKTWDIKFHIGNSGRHMLSAGWSGFVRCSKLQEGDICIFEVLKSKRRVTMAVHLLKGSHYLSEGVPSSRSQYSVNASHGVVQPGYMVHQFSSLTRLQKRKVEEEIRAIESEIPIFVAVMQYSNVAANVCILPFSQEYAVKYLPREEQQIMTLRWPGTISTWKAEFRIKNKEHRLCRGWRQFVDDNRVQQGDICLFQLLKNEVNLTMNVCTIRERRCGRR